MKYNPLLIVVHMTCPISFRRMSVVFAMSLALNCGRLNYDGLNTGSDACSEEPCDPAIDNDQDGFNQTMDCDDTNAEVHPEAEEICDGVDNNCDELIDGLVAGQQCGDSFGCIDGQCVPLPEDCAEPTGFNGQLYVECTEDLSWQEARQVCQAWNGDLVSINTSEEQIFIVDFRQTETNWIGYTDTGLEINDFRWVDGTPTDFNNWCTGEPTNFSIGDDSEDCAVLQTCNDDNAWNDLVCSWPNPYICERPQG